MAAVRVGRVKGLAQPVLVGADALHQVPEALDQHAAGQHVGQGGDVLAVAVGLVEGLGEAGWTPAGRSWCSRCAGLGSE